MNPKVTFEKIGHAASLTIDGPPGNLLTADISAALLSRLEDVAADRTIGAVVLRGAGDVFSLGAEVDDPAAPRAGPDLAELCRRVEAFPKPVIACLHGKAVGAGLDLALAAHWRLASSETRIGFPEVSLGLLPAGGGAVRAPRLAGAAVALDLMLTGAEMEAESAASAGLLDGVFLQDVWSAAMTLAEDLASKGIGLRRSTERQDGFADPVAYLAEIRQRRDEVIVSRGPAILRIFDCVESALLLPAEQALAFAQDSYDECLDTPESRALRHVYLAERRTARHGIGGSGRSRRPSHLGVFGAGPAGVELASAALDAGLKLTLAVPAGDTREAAAGTIEAAHLDAIDRQSMSEAAAVEQLSRFSTVDRVEALSSCDVIFVDPAHVEALPQIDEKVGSVPVLAFPAPFPDLERHVALVANPERVVGLHFAGPVRTSQVLEIVETGVTAGWAGASACGLAVALGRWPVRARAGESGIGERVLAAGLGAAGALIGDGLPPEEVDRSLREVDFSIGAYLGVRKVSRPRSSRPIQTDTVRRRVFAAMANAGARLLAEGIAVRPSDIDVVMIHAHGFPRWLGGPMQWADETGLLLLRDDLRRWSIEAPEVWAPCPLWTDLVKNGRKFSNLNG